VTCDVPWGVSNHGGQKHPCNNDRTASQLNNRDLRSGTGGEHLKYRASFGPKACHRQNAHHNTQTRADTSNGLVDFPRHRVHKRRQYSYLAPPHCMHQASNGGGALDCGRVQAEEIWESHLVAEGKRRRSETQCRYESRAKNELRLFIDLWRYG